MTGKIRFATEKDTKEILEIYAPYIEKTAITFEYEVPSLSEFSGRTSFPLSGNSVPFPTIIFSSVINPPPI